MNRFGMWFNNMMRGRYGTDNLNRFLLTAAFIIIVIDIFLRWRILDLITVALLIYVYCRMFSRNINARYRENQKFLQFISRFRGRSTDAAHKILRCPAAEKAARSQGAGKINISCPHCGTKFIKKV